MAGDCERRCPRCERALVDAPDGPRCLYCGYDFSVPPEDIEGGEYFSGAECGVLGLLAGLEIGAALGLASSGSTPVPGATLSSAGVGAVLGAVLGGWLGNRFSRPRRRSFRLLLLSACGAGLGVLVMTAAGWGSVDSVVLGSVILTVLIYLSALYAARYGARAGKAGDIGE